MYTLYTITSLLVEQKEQQQRKALSKNEEKIPEACLKHQTQQFEKIFKKEKFDQDLDRKAILQRCKEALISKPTP